MGSISQLREETRIAVEAVSAAAVVARGRAAADEVTVKGLRDVVTGTDLAVEEAVSAMLRDQLGMDVVGEERGQRSGRGAESYWLIDPICGTRNFASRIPLYCTNAALVESGDVTAAVVGDPSNDEIFVAERGSGAWLVKAPSSLHPVAVSDESETLVIEDSHADTDAGRRARAAAAVGKAIEAFRWDIRAFSTTLALPYVASGRVAAYVLFWTSSIHAAAGSLIAAEAGAVVSDIDGEPWTLASDSLVASATPALHADLLDLIQGRQLR